MEAAQDIKKYGASLPSEKLAAATLQGSLSCRAVLGLIITKSVYLFKDTEKIGLYIQLVKEAWRSLKEIYRVDGNLEFTELLHLILFAFDQVSMLPSFDYCAGLRFLPRLNLRRGPHHPSALRNVRVCQSFEYDIVREQRQVQDAIHRDAFQEHRETLNDAASCTIHFRPMRR